MRPTTWYLNRFLIPSGTAPEKSGDTDEDEDMGEIPESAGLVCALDLEREKNQARYGE